MSFEFEIVQSLIEYFVHNNILVNYEFGFIKVYFYANQAHSKYQILRQMLSNESEQIETISSAVA